MTVLVLRDATIDDADLLLSWRNDPAVRSTAFTTEVIERDQHVRWLNGKLAQPQRTKIRIALQDGRPVGQVRYDKTDDRTAEVDVSIDTAWRGKGFGSEILRLSVAESCRDLGVRHVVAVIKSDNAASLRAFVSAGFVRSHDEIRGGVPCAVLTWSCA